MCYNITNPLHYIAANEPAKTIALLQTFGLRNFAPATDCDLYDAVDQMVLTSGDRFINAMNENHPDREMLESEVKFSGLNENYRVYFKTASLDTIDREILSLTQQLASEEGRDEKISKNIHKKMDFLKEARTTATNKPVVPEEQKLSTIHKNNQYILLALAALALMYFGSKIFKAT